jgi:peptidoglycan hydrolase-like protein with peptidoglycan-binding domain
MMMKQSFSKIALGAASVLILGIGSAALDYPAQACDMTNATKMPSELQVAGAGTKELIRRADIRWAQTELRVRGMYGGSLDGVLGPETRQAIARFQQNTGLERTSSLDAQTWQALTGEPGVEQGSSVPPASKHGSPEGASPASELGR